MNLFHFDQASPQDNDMIPMSTTYDFHPISPTALESSSMFGNHDMSSQMHGNPGTMWSGMSQPALDGGLEKLLNNYGTTMERYGQVTPPDDANMQETTKSFGKRADSGASGMEVNDASSMSPRSFISSKRPSVRSSQKSRKESRTSEDGLTGDKKDKYREKNRVAAAKCRAKKKEHTDQLEDTYRTQSAMNSALKQTEKSLRDELSYWRTQALQHTFCSCHSIQEYNMRKAQSMAFGTNYGTTSSPVMADGRSASFSHNHMRSSSAAGIASPVMSEINGKTPSTASLSGVPDPETREMTRQ
ncbi:unnamed protein product [Aureobasidium vineae]|uniref:BZIP domain-containing protein n=1 Tax=Aureobasidium vineae TaxID=2773715 RepID=A0A9N8K3S2_9PEZI|nr:unnamed protein product [Aureobasidium vineae]